MVFSGKMAIATFKLIQNATSLKSLRLRDLLTFGYLWLSLVTFGYL